MPSYSYKARNARGELLSGSLEGASPDAVAEELLRSGLTPVGIAPFKAAAAAGFDLRRLFEDKIRPLDLMLFSRQMASLLKAGVPILRALASLAESSAKPPMQAMLTNVREGLAAGRELSACLRRYPAVFSDFYLSMVRVGEATGRLDEVFLRLFHHIEFEVVMRERVKSALRYPTFVVVALLIALGVINVVVIPAFAKVYTSAHAELPLLTQLLIGVSQWTTRWWPALIGVVIAAYLGFRTWRATAAGRYTWDRYLLKLPIAGRIVRKAALARFARGLAMAYTSGVPITQGLASVALVVDNRFIAGRIDQMREGVERGESLTRVAATTGVFTPVVLQMLAVGEETGELDRLLNEIGEMYQREVEYDVKTLSDQLEPILIAVLGGVVLIVALGVFLPMWDLGSAMNRR